MGDWGTASPTWHSRACSFLGIPVMKDRVCTGMARPALEGGPQLPWPGSLRSIQPLESKPRRRRPACWDWQVLGRPDIEHAGAVVPPGYPRAVQTCRGQPWKRGHNFPRQAPWVEMPPMEDGVHFLQHAYPWGGQLWKREVQLPWSSSLSPI